MKTVKLRNAYPHWPRALESDRLRHASPLEIPVGSLRWADFGCSVRGGVVVAERSGIDTEAF